MEHENNSNNQSQPNQSSNSNRKLYYDYFWVNHEQDTLVMLKKIPDMLPLLTTQPIVILLNLQKLEQKIKDVELPNLCFQDV